MYMRSLYIFLGRISTINGDIALIYGRWSWYERLAHPATQLEVVTSRPLFLAEVARLTEHSGQSRLLLTLTHAAGDLIKSMIANVRKGLDTIPATAPQLTKRERWQALVRYIVEKSSQPNQNMTFNLRSCSQNPRRISLNLWEAKPRRAINF
jgi:hypothetical protein